MQLRNSQMEERHRRRYCGGGGSGAYRASVTNLGELPSSTSMSSPTRKFSEPLCCCSGAKSRPTLCDSMDYSTSGSSVLHYLPNFAQIHVELVMLSNHLILCCPLLHLHSIFPSIRGFSNESALHIRWPKYWSFRFRNSTSNEYSGLISFRIDCFYLLSVQQTLKSLL